MALASTNLTSSSFLRHEISNFFAVIGRGLVTMAEADPRLKQMESLSDLTDAELAQKGLKRADIARHVLRNKIYL